MITLINKMTVTGDMTEFRRVNSYIADYMSEQPGALRFQLLWSPTTPEVFVEVAEWDSAEHHKAAVSTPEFRERVRELPGLATVERARYEILRLDDDRAIAI